MPKIDEGVFEMTFRLKYPRTCDACGFEIRAGEECVMRRVKESGHWNTYHFHDDFDCLYGGTGEIMEDMFCQIGLA
jgi:hypothetical protein